MGVLFFFDNQITDPLNGKQHTISAAKSVWVPNKGAVDDDDGSYCVQLVINDEIIVMNRQDSEDFLKGVFELAIYLGIELPVVLGPVEPDEGH